MLGNHQENQILPSLYWQQKICALESSDAWRYTCLKKVCFPGAVQITHRLVHAMAYILPEVASNNLPFKEIVAQVWVWLKVVWMERAKIGEDPLMFLI
jgi:hypothetical protein